MFPSVASTSISEEASVSSETRAHVDFNSLNTLLTPFSPQEPHLHRPHDQPFKSKKKRSQPGNPDPEAEVVALSPKTLLATNRFVCEICNKGFQRDQNLQLHRRGHNLPWRLRQRSGKEAAAARKRVYVCPEPSCVHHNPSRALGDLTGIKKHFCRKHGEKKWKCDKCSKKYAVHSDCKAHAKTCGTREYRCDCGTLFSRKDSFITHRAFCDALAEESARLTANITAFSAPPLHRPDHFLPFSTSWNPPSNPNPNDNSFSIPIPNPNPNYKNTPVFHVKKPDEDTIHPIFHPHLPSHHLQLPAAAAAAPHMSATTLLQRASAVGRLPPTSTVSDRHRSYDAATSGVLSACQSGADRLTRDFLGVVSSDVAGEELIPLSGLGLDPVTSFPCSRGGDHTKPLPGFGFPPATGAWGDY